MKILAEYRVCDLRIQKCLTRFGEIEWFLIDEGQQDADGLGERIAQGSREAVVARLQKEMEEAL